MHSMVRVLTLVVVGFFVQAHANLLSPLSPAATRVQAPRIFSPPATVYARFKGNAKTKYNDNHRVSTGMKYAPTLPITPVPGPSGWSIHPPRMDRFDIINNRDKSRVKKVYRGNKPVTVIERVNNPELLAKEIGDDLGTRTSVREIAGPKKMMYRRIRRTPKYNIPQYTVQVNNKDVDEVKAWVNKQLGVETSSVAQTAPKVPPAPPLSDESAVADWLNTYVFSTKPPKPRRYGGTRKTDTDPTYKKGTKIGHEYGGGYTILETGGPPPPKYGSKYTAPAELFTQNFFDSINAPFAGLIGFSVGAMSAFVSFFYRRLVRSTYSEPLLNQ